MSEILTDVSEPALIQAIRLNLYGMFDALERAPTVDFLRRPELLRWHTAIPHPLFQGVLVRADAPGKEAQLVREARDYFIAQGLPFLSWWFSPGLDATPWEAALRSQDFLPDDDPPGMAVVLDDLAAPAPPAQLSIVRVQDRELLRLWNRTFVEGYELPQEMSEAFYELLLGIGLGGALQHYLAYQDGVPVATSSCWLAAGVAGIYNVATIPAARRQGLGAAITLAPLREAQAQGYRAGILQSSAEGFGVYQRLGFRHLCALDHYTWVSHGAE